MAVTKDMLVSELQDLLRLTSFEQTIAQLRRTQAATPAVADELQANAERARERQQLLVDAVRQAGGVPDVVGAAVGRAGAFLQTQVNQVQTLQGALLGDLALEHQLRERARYARTLAVTLGHTQVLPVLDRLETAHTATIAWLEERLAEVGRTGTSALRATPLQNLVAATWRTLGVPYAVTAATVNRASSLLSRGAKTAATTAAKTAATAAQTAATTAAQTAGTVAGAGQQAAAEVEERVIDLTGVDEEREPFPAYSRLSGDSVMRHLADTEDVEHVREVLAYEQAHKDRPGVVQAAQERLAELSVAP